MTQSTRLLTPFVCSPDPDKRKSCDRSNISFVE